MALTALPADALEALRAACERPHPPSNRTPLLPDKPGPSLSAPCAAMCEVGGDHSSQGLLHAPSSFIVVARDASGARLSTGGAKLRLSSRGPSPLKPEATDLGDGSYRVTYHATISGEYQMTISINSKPLQASPLMIRVEPSTAHAPSCVAVGDGLLVGVAGDQAEFVVRAFDEQGRPKIMGGEIFEAHLVPHDLSATHVQAGAQTLALP
ncbi:MAG: hypothetical protein SGPRY_002246 [Prymnesium sp.]